MIFFSGDKERWKASALCAQTDPEVWFPTPGPADDPDRQVDGNTTQDAKAICLRCPVRTDCLQYALEHDIRHGIWGGVAERERRQLAKRLAG